MIAMEVANPNAIKGPEDEFYCKLCNKNNNNLGNFNRHLGSAKHLKKSKLQEKDVKEAENQNNIALPNEEDVKISCFEVGKDDEDDLTNCKICNKSFLTRVIALGHYASKGHLRKLSIAEKTWEDKCVTCNKKFCSEASWQNHINSERHKKLTQQAANPPQILSKAKPKNGNDDEADDDDDDEFEKNVSITVLEKLSCDICGKKFSGKKPAELHLNGKAHSKLVAIKKKLIPKNNGSNDDPSEMKPKPAVAPSRKRILDNDDDDDDDDDEIPRKK